MINTMIFMPSENQLTNYTHYAYYFRGAVLNEVSSIELLIEDIIACFFFSDKQDRRLKFQNILNRKFKNFDTKVEMLMEILENNGIENESIENLKRDLKQISVRRNIAAHWILSTSNEDIKTFDIKKPSVKLMRLKSKATPLKNGENPYENMEVQHLTSAWMNETIPKIQNTILELNQIRKHLEV